MVADHVLHEDEAVSTEPPTEDRRLDRLAELSPKGMPQDVPVTDVEGASELALRRGGIRRILEASGQDAHLVVFSHSRMVRRHGGPGRAGAPERPCSGKTSRPWRLDPCPAHGGAAAGDASRGLAGRRAGAASPPEPPLQGMAT